jgi:hypothetical protein
MVELGRKVSLAWLGEKQWRLAQPDDVLVFPGIVVAFNARPESKVAYVKLDNEAPEVQEYNRRLAEERAELIRKLTRSDVSDGDRQGINNELRSKPKVLDALLVVSIDELDKLQRAAATKRQRTNDDQ